MHNNCIKKHDNEYTKNEVMSNFLLPAGFGVPDPYKEIAPNSSVEEGPKSGSSNFS